ncbi:MAG: DUF4160 domain-containing protein [Deltaproteobacteria bacterium]|nr:DUF4160 domain-containing protein [Deltaproteobacteria bacterium]
MEIKIKAAEHGNPHVYAWYQRQQVKIFIRTLDVKSGGLPPKQMRKLIEDQEVMDMKFVIAVGLAALLLVTPSAFSSDDYWTEMVDCCLRGCS